MSDKLVTQLQRALFQQQMPADENEKKKEYATLTYISNVLLSDDGPHLNVEISPELNKSYQNYLNEFASIIEPSSSTTTQTSVSMLASYSSKRERLHKIVMEAGKAVAAKDSDKFDALVKELSTFASVNGDCLERVAFYFIQALIARLSDNGPLIHQALAMAIKSREHIRIRMLSLPAFKVMHLYIKEMILAKCLDARCIHIVDYGIFYGTQWPCIIERLSRQPQPPHLKMTGIDYPHRIDVSVTGCKLGQCAKMYNIPLEYHAVPSYAWETVQPKCSHEEVLIVNCTLRLRHIKEDGTAAKNPRRMLFETIRKLSPQMLLVCVSNASLSSPLFLPRFQEAVKYYTAKMEYFDSVMTDYDPQGRELMDKIISRSIMNVVACEGQDRIEELNTYQNWDLRIRQAGFRQMRLADGTLETVTRTWNECEHSENAKIDRDENWILLGWKGVVLYAMCAFETVCEYSLE